jgi:hypothetical protein
MVAQWHPLEEPTTFISTFRSWRRALKLSDVDEKPQTQVDVYGTKTIISPSSHMCVYLLSSVVAIILSDIFVFNSERPMTPFESLLWNVWLPKVRSCLNNDWSPQDPQPAVRLYEAWSTFLPPFIRDNVLDQLVLPKVHQAVNDWNPRKDTVSLQALVFPWLPHLGLRLEDVLGDARRKVKSLLRGWSAEDEMPEDLVVWKDVSAPAIYTEIIAHYLLFSGFQRRRLGRNASQICRTQTGGNPSQRFPRRSSQTEYGTTRTCSCLVGDHSPFYLLPTHRNRVFHQMAGRPAHLADTAQSQLRRGGTVVSVLERFISRKRADNAWRFSWVYTWITVDEQGNRAGPRCSDASASSRSRCGATNSCKSQTTGYSNSCQSAAHTYPGGHFPLSCGGLCSRTQPLVHTHRPGTRAVSYATLPGIADCRWEGGIVGIYIGRCHMGTGWR